jgi:hypothetical protein
MTMSVWFLWTVIPFITFWYGWELGRASDRSKDRAWCDGYAAGLAESDRTWPTVVRRWEMDA